MAQDGSRTQQDTPSARYALGLTSFCVTILITSVHLVRPTYTLASQAAFTRTPSYFSSGYVLPQSSLPTHEASICTTTCSDLIPVFVHDAGVTSSKGGSRNKNSKEGESCDVVNHVKEPLKGTVCLKSLVKAICLSRLVNPSDVAGGGQAMFIKLTYCPFVRKLSHHEAPRTSTSTSTLLSSENHQLALPNSIQRKAPRTVAPRLHHQHHRLCPVHHLSCSKSRLHRGNRLHGRDSMLNMQQINTSTDALGPAWPSSTIFPAKRLSSCDSLCTHGFQWIEITNRTGPSAENYRPLGLAGEWCRNDIVTGRLIRAGSHMIGTVFDDLSLKGSSAAGVETLAKHSQQAIPAILEVELILSAPISMNNSVQTRNVLTPDVDMEVYHAIGLVWEPEGISKHPKPRLREDSSRSQPIVFIQPQPDCTSSSSGAIVEDYTATTHLSSTSKEVTFSARAPFQPFRSTCSEIALLEYESSNRDQHRELNYTSGPPSLSREDPPSNTSSRTRSPTGSKRRAVSVVIDKADQPVRERVGAKSPVTPAAITAASNTTVNQKSSQPNAHSESKGDSMPASGEYKSESSFVVVIGSVAYGEYLITLEYEFFGEGFVSLKRRRCVDLGFFGIRGHKRCGLLSLMKLMFKLFKACLHSYGSVRQVEASSSGGVSRAVGSDIIHDMVFITDGMTGDLRYDEKRTSNEHDHVIDQEEWVGHDVQGRLRWCVGRMGY